MPPRKKLAARPRCEPCGGLAIYPDRLTAQFQAAYTQDLHAYPCPRCPGRWHLGASTEEHPR